MLTFEQLNAPRGWRIISLEVWNNISSHSFWITFVIGDFCTVLNIDVCIFLVLAAWTEFLFSLWWICLERNEWQKAICCCSELKSARLFGGSPDRVKQEEKAPGLGGKGSGVVYGEPRQQRTIRRRRRPCTLSRYRPRSVRNHHYFIFWVCWILLCFHHKTTDYISRKRGIQKRQSFHHYLKDNESSYFFLR